MSRQQTYTLVYGLSADPVHQAHVDMVVEGVRALQARYYSIARILIIPVYWRNPTGAQLKDNLPDTFDHRFAMSVLAASEMQDRLGQPVEVSRIEEKLVKLRQKPNYTVETLAELHSTVVAGSDLILLMGSDLVAGDDPELGRWYGLNELLQMATIAIYPRVGFRENDAFLERLEQEGAQLIRLDDLMVAGISASQLLERLRNGDDPLVLSKEGLMPESVALYIKQHNLYSVAGE